MRSFKLIATLVVALGLVTVASAAGSGGGPPAHAAGGDAGPLLYPSLVNVRLVRGEAALQRAVEYADEGQADKAVAALANARLHVRKAWTGAKYLIDHAPAAPPAGDGRVGRTSGAPVGASPYASIYDTALAVLGLQHDAASASFGLIDSAKGTLLSSLSTTVFAALNGRDAAMLYIHSIAPPPVAGDGRVGRSSGAPVASWGSVMPQAASQLDDEIQQIDGTLAGTLSAGASRVLKAAELQDVKTQKTLNQFWPPAPADG
jgi:hypothetical protein